VEFLTNNDDKFKTIKYLNMISLNHVDIY